MNGSINMEQEKICHGCQHESNCSSLYDHLCNTKGPSIAAKAMFAFALPIVTFIISLLVLEDKTFVSAKNENLNTAVNALLALAMTAAITTALNLIRKKISKTKDGLQTQNGIT